MTSRLPPLFDRIPTAAKRTKPPDVRCGTCAHWDRAAARDAAGRVRGDRLARCLWELPESVQLPPGAVMRRYGGQFTRDEGKACPAWIPLVGAKPVAAKR